MFKKIIFFFILLLPLTNAVGVSPAKIDFGEVRRGEVIVFSFTIFNDLNKDMEYSFSGEYIQPIEDLRLEAFSNQKINASLIIPNEFYLKNFSGIFLIKEKHENNKINLINSVGMRYFFIVLNPLKEIQSIVNSTKEVNKTEIGVLEFINISNIGFKKPTKIQGAFYNYGDKELNCNLECEIYFNGDIIDFIKSSSVLVKADGGILLEVYFTPLDYGEYSSKCRVNYGEYTPFVESRFLIERPNSITGNFFLTPEKSIFSGLFILVVLLGLLFIIKYSFFNKQNL